MKNALEGFAEDYREDGSAFRLQQSFWTADSVDEFNKQYVLSIGMYDNTYSVEDMIGSSEILVHRKQILKNSRNLRKNR